VSNHVRFYFRATQTEPTTGGAIYDLSPTQGSDGQLGTLPNAENSFLTTARWRRSLGGMEITAIVPTSLNITGMNGNNVYRWRINRLNASGAILGSSDWSTERSSTGVQTQTFTPPTGVYELIEIEFQSARSGGMPSNQSVNIGVSDINSWIEAEIEEPSEDYAHPATPQTINVSSTATGTAFSYWAEQTSFAGITEPTYHDNSVVEGEWYRYRAAVADSGSAITSYTEWVQAQASGEAYFKSISDTVNISNTAAGTAFEYWDEETSFIAITETTYDDSTVVEGEWYQYQVAVAEDGQAITEYTEWVQAQAPGEVAEDYGDSVSESINVSSSISGEGVGSDVFSSTLPATLPFTLGVEVVTPSETIAVSSVVSGRKNVSIALEENISTSSTAEGLSNAETTLSETIDITTSATGEIFIPVDGETSTIISVSESASGVKAVSNDIVSLVAVTVQISGLMGVTPPPTPNAANIQIAVDGNKLIFTGYEVAV